LIWFGQKSESCIPKNIRSPTAMEKSKTISPSPTCDAFYLLSNIQHCLNHTYAVMLISKLANSTLAHIMFNTAVLLTIFKGQVHCFSMQVVMNKCFLLNTQKIGADPSCRFRENVSLIPKNDVTEPKASCSNYQLKSC